MASAERLQPMVTGLGVTSAIGQGADAFAEALFAGASRMGFLRREGRQAPDRAAFIGAEIDELALPDVGTTRWLSLSSRAALATLREAWVQADLGDVDPTRIGLVIGGSNVQQRELLCYMRRGAFLSPAYGFAHLDTDLIGACTEAFGIKGPAFTVGAASASGQMAVIQAANLLAGGELDACIALGALSDLSHFECSAFEALGAMVQADADAAPCDACRPFDQAAGGFVYGEGCAAIVLERPQRAAARGRRPLAHLTGWAAGSDGNRNPNPAREGEIRVIRQALARAGLDARRVDYVNPHGSGSRLGDQVEVEALAATGLAEAPVNATKSITGHTLAAAGLVELVATILQMQAGRLHPTLNLEAPISDAVNWVTEAASADVRTAINLSHGFGGLNTAVCVERASKDERDAIRRN